MSAGHKASLPITLVEPPLNRTDNNQRVAALRNGSRHDIAGLNQSPDDRCPYAERRRCPSDRAQLGADFSVAARHHRPVYIPSAANCPVVLNAVHDWPPWSERMYAAHESRSMRKCPPGVRQ